MTTRSQQRKAVAELSSGEFEASVTENSQPGNNLVAGHSKSPKILVQKLEEMKISLRNKIMTYLSKILAENQKEILRLIAPIIKKPTIHQNEEDSDFEAENNLPTSTSTPIKSKATTSRTTPISSRYNCCLRRRLSASSDQQNQTVGQRIEQSIESAGKRLAD